MILSPVEAIVAILAHGAFKNLLLFAVLARLSNDVAESCPGTRDGIDNIDHFSRIWLTSDSHNNLQTIALMQKGDFRCLLQPTAPRWKRLQYRAFRA